MITHLDFLLEHWKKKSTIKCGEVNVIDVVQWYGIPKASHEPKELDELHKSQEKMNMSQNFCVSTKNH